MQLPNNKKYFASDQHFAPTPELSFPENKNRGSYEIKNVSSFIRRFI
jgi:hypothetical protein